MSKQQYREPEPKKQSFLDETIEHNLGHPATPRDKVFAWILIAAVVAAAILAVAAPMSTR